MVQLYNEQIWDRWVYEESTNYELKEIGGKLRKVYKQKGYLHFDPRFWFPERLREIKQIVSDPAMFAKWEFYPFLQIITETRRFKHDLKEGKPIQSIKKRPLCYAAHQDALIYSFYSFCLTKIYETFLHNQKLDDCVLAYRTDLDGACNIQFAKEVFEYIKKTGECTAIALDIKGFFNNLDHQLLKQKWATVIGEYQLPNEQYKLYKTLTQFAFTNQEDLLNYLNIDLKKTIPFPKSLLDLFPKGNHSKLFRELRKREVIKIQRKIGIPQGSPMSSILSNIYMIDFDARLNQLAKEKSFLYKRYCDDILVVCADEVAIEVKEVIYDAIQDSKLIIQPEKEEEIIFKYDFNKKLRALNAKSIQNKPHLYSPGREHYFYKSLQYLGFDFNGQDVLIRNSSICRFYKKLKRRATKSVKMAYSPKGLGDKVFTQTTYQRYSHLGKRNFLSYAYRCAAQTYENSEGVIKMGMNSLKIRRQLARHMKLLNISLNSKNKKRHIEKSTKNKVIKLKRV